MFLRGARNYFKRIGESLDSPFSWVRLTFWHKCDIMER